MAEKIDNSLTNASFYSSGNIAVNAGGPLDARVVAPTYSALSQADTWKYKESEGVYKSALLYNGLTVTVTDTSKVYVLSNYNSTTVNNPSAWIWTQVGSDVSLATTANTGVVQIGSNINVNEQGVISVPAASSGTLGVVEVGSGLSITPEGLLSANGEPIATTANTGTVKIGNNINVTDNGVISVPIATDSSLGVVKIGSGLSIDQNGVLNATGTEVGMASKDAFGVVKIGDNIDVSTGVISVPLATSATTAGVVKVGTGLSVESDGTLSVSVEPVVYDEGSGITIDENNVINANAYATTPEEIIISTGAPIKDATGIWEDDIIPSGTSILDILKNLLCKEIYPSVATEPSSSISLGATLSGIKEKSSKVTIPSATISGTTGVFDKDQTALPSDKQVKPSMSWSSISLSSVITSGFTNYVEKSSSGESFSNVSISNQTSVTVSLGTNIITYSGSADYSAPTNKPKTNLGNYTSRTGKTADEGTALWVSGTSTPSKTVTITGVYPCFCNISGASVSINNNVVYDNVAHTASYVHSGVSMLSAEDFIAGDTHGKKCSLVENSFAIKLDTVAETTENENIKFAFPSNRTATLYLVGLDGKKAGVQGASTVENAFTYLNKSYNYITTSGRVGLDMMYLVELSKKLSIE